VKLKLASPAKFNDRGRGPPVSRPISDRPIPEKVVLWLTDPLVIEVEGFVPPGKARIVPLDTHQGDTNTLDENNAQKTFRKSSAEGLSSSPTLLR
jgi:hypothetical protein